MRLDNCSVRDSNTTCDLPVAPSLPFCGQHYEEYCRLKECVNSAVHDSTRLESVVKEIEREGVEGYMKVRDIQRDRTMVQLYVDAVGREIDASETLERRLENGHSNDRSLNDLKERRAAAAALIERLEERARNLEAEATATIAYDEVRANLRALIAVPHKPLQCDPVPVANANSTQPWRCPTIRSLTSSQCTSTPSTGQRLCSFHLGTHASVALIMRSARETLEKSRQAVVQLDVARGDRSSNIAVVKAYIGSLDRTEDLANRHQSTYSCASSVEHQTFLEDLQRRRTSAAVMLGELHGRRDVEIALRQGQTEDWASDYLSQMHQADKEAQKTLLGNTAVGAALGAGMATVVGGPLGMGAAFGALLMGFRSTSRRTGE